MPDANAGPADSSTVTAEDGASQPLPGFADAMIDFGNPTESSGEPATRSAVEISAADEPPAPEVVKPEKAPATVEPVKPDATKTPNFDGLSDEDKKTYERLWKAGFVSEEEVERFRKNTLYQQSWTKNNMLAADEVKAAKARVAEVEKWKTEQDDKLRRLERILSDDRRHDAFMRASADEFTEESVDPNQPISRAEAARIADERYDARVKADADRTAKEKREYAEKATAMKQAVREEQRLLGIDDATLKSLLAAEESELPSDVDPVLRYSPAELRRILALRHRVAVAEAKATTAQQQVKSGQSESRSKQSLAPSVRRSETGQKDPWSQALADLHVEPDMSNVQGLGGWGSGAAP